MEAIPKDLALHLCEEIRRENRGRWYTSGGMMCWGCRTFSKGNPDKMCFSSRPDYRGCHQISARYDHHARGL